MENLNKKTLVEVISDKTRKKKKSATEVVDLVLETVADTLKDGGKVDLSGFGKFEVKVRNARTGINPATRETIQIPATKVPSFKPAKALKDLVK